MGRIAFGDLIDATGKLQLSLEPSMLGDSFAIVRWLLGLGDIVGQSMTPTTVCVGRPPRTITAIAPSSAIPVRSSWSPGTRPAAMPR
jgi:hypothetical protein